MKSLIYLVIAVMTIFYYSQIYAGGNGFVSEFSRAITQATGAAK